MTAVAAAPEASVLHPAGEQAAVLHEINLVLIVGGTLIFVGMLLLLARAVWPRPRREVPLSRWVLDGGVVFPAVVLGLLWLYASGRSADLDRMPAAPALTIAVTGHLWWWDLRYHDAASGLDLRGANELRLPAGRPTLLGLASADVIHSFWVPALGGKRDLVPGRVNHLMITPTRPGVYGGVCAEYCGLQHARMALRVVVMPPAEFDRWLAAQAVPAAPAASAESAAAESGRQAFVAQGCAACHTVRGVAEQGALGPDLTHVAGRMNLGAGVLRNGPGAMRQWLVSVQALKPGARMPSYAHLDAATLDALARWLEQLH
ncbi:cytochrome c oxidase subunit II [Aquabacterium sp.]|uniref:cytochrome c oxidase subunit II n=1 Tax=Aquabacterium sp. TaxID=1872578 RepID=UPI002C496EC3|nr:c-type cytochrome [Aquabacterium sp.]HSW04299.1 c-type cytochrome [Aquabacterium sp.]